MTTDISRPAWLSVAIPFALLSVATVLHADFLPLPSEFGLRPWRPHLSHKGGVALMLAER